MYSCRPSRGVADVERDLEPRQTDAVLSHDACRPIDEPSVVDIETVSLEILDAAGAVGSERSARSRC